MNPVVESPVEPDSQIEDETPTAEPASQAAPEILENEAGQSNIENNSESSEQPLADWAKGVPTGLSPSEGITTALEERMRQMTAAHERLEVEKTPEENINRSDSTP